jgi:phosphoglycolate phosphatase-like HAD superfamily hydrolase
MDTIKCLSIDFDGVLIDSNAIKHNAYFDIFAGLGDTRAIVESCWTGNQDGNRYQVIACILRQLENVGVLDTNRGWSELIEYYVEKYNTICEAHTATCSEILGASACLPRLAQRYALYINSATPEEPLRRVVRRRQWNSYFRDVLGGPRSKAENLRWVMEREQVDCSSTVFVGDGPQDLVAASTSGCRFIGVRHADNNFDPEGLIVVDDWYQIEETLRAW